MDTRDRWAEAESPRSEGSDVTYDSDASDGDSPWAAGPAPWMARVQEARVQALEALGGGPGVDSGGGGGGLAHARAALSALRILAGDADGAARAAEAALAHDGDMAAALTCLGMAHAARGCPGEAEAALEAALARAPHSAVAAWRLALLRRGDGQEAALRTRAARALAARLQEARAAAVVPPTCRAPAAFSPDLLLAPRALRALRAAGDAWAAAGDAEDACACGWPRAAAVDWRAALWATVLHAPAAWPAAALPAARAALEVAAAGGGRGDLALLAAARLHLAGPAPPSSAAVNAALRLLHAAQQQAPRGDAALEACCLLYRVQAAKAAAGARDPRLGREVARLARAALDAAPGQAEALRVAAVQVHAQQPAEALRLLDAALAGLLAADERWARAAAAGGRERPVRHAALRQWLASTLSDRGFVLLALHVAGHAGASHRPVPGFEGAARLWRSTCATIGLEAEEVVRLEEVQKRASWSLPEVAAHDLAASVGLMPERGQAFRGLALAFAALGSHDLAARCLEHSRAIDGSAAAQHELDEALRPGAARVLA